MLDLSRRYFVAVGGHSEIEISRWAKRNAMTLGKTVYLSACGLAYELNVEHNDKLEVVIRRELTVFKNGQEVIGEASFGICGGKIGVVVYL